MGVHPVLLQGEAGRLPSGLGLSLPGCTHRTCRSGQCLQPKATRALAAAGPSAPRRPSRALASHWLHSKEPPGGKICSS